MVFKQFCCLCLIGLIFGQAPLVAQEENKKEEKRSFFQRLKDINEKSEQFLKERDAKEEKKDKEKKKPKKKTEDKAKKKKVKKEKIRKGEPLKKAYKVDDGQEKDKEGADSVEVIPFDSQGAEPQLTKEQQEQKKEASDLLKKQQFKKVADILDQLPEHTLTTEDKFMLDKIALFDSVDKMEKEENSLFKREEPDEHLKKTLKRLYKAAQEAILQKNDILAKDMLIQMLYLDRRNFKAKKLLDIGLSLPIGSYKVENVEAKYWKRSLIYFYSGYPEKALKDLKILEAFDAENSDIFERMGSCYYAMGEPKEAIKVWKRALYLDPTKKDLNEFITNAEKEAKRQQAFVKSQLAKKKKRQKTVESDVPMQTLRITNDANVAYSYAQEVRKELKGVNVVVEELDNGKWAVMIPKKKDTKAKQEEKK